LYKKSTSPKIIVMMIQMMIQIKMIVVVPKIKNVKNQNVYAKK